METTAAGYAPQAPLQATWTSVLSQDVVMTSSVLAQSSSPSPVGAFTNAATGAVEALVVSTQSGLTGQLCHVARDPATDGGWQQVALGVAATEVVAGTALPGTSAATSYGFFAGETGLHSAQLGADGATWTTAPVNDASNASVTAVNLRVAYTPSNQMRLYGSTAAGDLVVASQDIGQPFVATVCSVGGVLAEGDFQLCMTDETTWILVANVNGQPQTFQGILGGTQAVTGEVAFDGTLKQTVLGYWSGTGNRVIFLLVDTDNALHVWSAASDTSSPLAQQIPNAR